MSTMKQGGKNNGNQRRLLLCRMVGETSWGECFTNRKQFDYENEALSFIANDLKNDPCVREAFYTTHKTIVFKKGE